MTKLENIRITTGLDIEYARAGDHGKSLLLLHGYADSWYSYNGMLEALPDDWCAYAPSQRGHGGSSKPEEGYSIEQYARDAVAFMDATGLRKVPVVGHSMGTFIAQEMALKFRDRVSHLVLIAAATTSDSAMLREFHRQTKLLIDPVPRQFAHEFQAGTCANPLGPGMTLERIVDESMKLPAHVWDSALGGLIGYRPPAEVSTPDLSAIDCPTLILWGDQDGIFLVDEQPKLRDLLTGSVLKIYPDVGHALHWEKPVESTADIVEFLSSPP